MNFRSLRIAALAAIVSAGSLASTPQQRLQAVLPLQRAVPEFEAFCGSFPSAHITVVQDDKRSEVLTIVVQASIAGKYATILIYEVAYKADFGEVDKILAENLGAHRLADSAAMKPNQVLAPRKLSRFDLKNIASDGDLYLDRLFGERPQRDDKSSPRKKG